MTTTIVTGHIDEQHRLIVEVPHSLPPGPVTVSIQSGQTDAHSPATDLDWQSAIATEWSNFVNDPREDLYSLSDGEPIRDGG